MAVVVYVDMDGTICDNRWRLVALREGRMSREQVYSSDTMLEDPEIPGAAAALRTLIDEGSGVVILTARDSGQRRATSTWLQSHHVPHGNVVTVSSAERKAPYLFHAADRVNDVLVDDFMGGYDIGIPTFVSHVYEACRKVIPVEVFRNNWREITDRITGRSR